MLDFHNTKLGRSFFEHDVPELVRAIKGLANQVKEQNETQQITNQLLARESQNSTELIEALMKQNQLLMEQNKLLIEQNAELSAMRPQNKK